MANETKDIVNKELNEFSTKKAAIFMGDPEMKEVLRGFTKKEFSPENFNFIELTKEALGGKVDGEVSLPKLVAVHCLRR